MIPLPYKLLAIVALCAASAFGLHAWTASLVSQGDTAGYNRRAAEDAAAIAQQKADAASTLAIETAKTTAAEKALAQATQKQDLQDAKHKTDTDVLAARLRALAGPAGRLRDPHAAPAGCGRGSSGAPGPATPAPADRPDDPPQAAGLLSAELSELLQSRLSEADAISAAYTSCRADAYTVRGAAQPPPHD